jgi:hypothetical protein
VDGTTTPNGCRHDQGNDRSFQTRCSPQRRAAGDIGELLHSLARALFDPYRPELHYMRGPGPKWHAKYDGPQPEAAVAALPLTPTHPSSALAAPVLIRCA